MEELYKSEAWAKASPLQRREFIAKVRADKRMEREAIREKEKKEKQVAKQQPPKQKTKRQKRAERRRQRANTQPRVFSGVDVTSDAFLLTFEWRKLRMQALKKYGPKCMCCGATPATGAVMNVDHIKPRKKHPELALDINNLQILCHDCNHGKGNWDQTDWRPK